MHTLTVYSAAAWPKLPSLSNPPALDWQGLNQPLTSPIAASEVIAALPIALKHCCACIKDLFTAILHAMVELLQPAPR